MKKMKKKLILCDNGNAEETSQKAKEYGFGIEIQAFYKPEKCEDENEIDIHKQYIKDIGPISFHAPFGDLCPGSFDTMVRDVARNRFELGYKVAEQLGASYMVFHIGWVPGAGKKEKRAERCANFRNEFLEGKSEKIQYNIENQFDFDPDVLVLVIDKIHKDNVKVCLDIGHAHCHSKIPVVEWIKILKDKIGYVHIHDNNGEEDEHLSIGKGTIPMIDVLNAINTYAPDAIRALECEVDESLAWLKKHKFL